MDKRLVTHSRDLSPSRIDSLLLSNQPTIAQEGPEDMDTGTVQPVGDMHTAALRTLPRAGAAAATAATAASAADTVFHPTPRSDLPWDYLAAVIERVGTMRKRFAFPLQDELVVALRALGLPCEVRHDPGLMRRLAQREPALQEWGELLGGLAEVGNRPGGSGSEQFKLSLREAMENRLQQDMLDAGLTPAVSAPASFTNRVLQRFCRNAAIDALPDRRELVRALIRVAGSGARNAEGEQELVSDALISAIHAYPLGADWSQPQCERLLEALHVISVHWGS